MRLVLVDDHPLVLQGMRSVLQLHGDMEVVDTATCGEEACRALELHQPDIALVDLRLQGEYGLDIVRRGRSLAPGCRFIILTSFSERGDIKQALAEKVDGYVLKEAMPEELIAAIRLAYKGRTYIDPNIIQILVEDRGNDPIEQLTPREMEVLAALAHGMANRDIADSLYVTEYTIKKHVSQILDKLNLADRTQAALFAYSRGMGRPAFLCS